MPRIVKNAPKKKPTTKKPTKEFIADEIDRAFKRGFITTLIVQSLIIVGIFVVKYNEDHIRTSFHNAIENAIDTYYAKGE